MDGHLRTATAAVAFVLAAGVLWETARVRPGRAPPVTGTRNVVVWPEGSRGGMGPPARPAPDETGAVVTAASIAAPGDALTTRGIPEPASEAVTTVATTSVATTDTPATTAAADPTTATATAAGTTAAAATAASASGGAHCAPKVAVGDIRCGGGERCGGYRTALSKSAGPRPAAAAAACCALCLADPECLTYLFMNQHGCALFGTVAEVLAGKSTHVVGHVLGRVVTTTTAPPVEPRTWGGTVRHSPECTQDGCTLRFPQAPPPTPSTPAELPTFPRSCFSPRPQKPGGATYGDHEDDFAPMGEGPAASLDACRALCVASASCSAWTFRAGGAGGGGGQGGGGMCSLHPAPPSDRLAYKASDREAACTSGLVRAGIARLPQGMRGWPVLGSGAVPPLPAAELPAPQSLDDVPVARFGTCHRLSCFDVHHCAKGWSEARDGKRYALVIADDLHRPSFTTRRGGGTRNLLATPDLVAMREAARVHGADMILMVPNDTAAEHPLLPEERKHLESIGVAVFEAPWVLPPRYRPHVNQGCARQDLFRLNAFRLVKYDSVVMYDRDVSVWGDITDVFKCAARNRFLTASGPLAPLNLGFIAFKPDLRLLAAAEHFVAEADYAHAGKDAPKVSPDGGFAGGWDGLGFAPFHRHFIGGDCGQGLYWALYYKNGERNTTDLLDRSWRAAGVERPPAYQLDRCIWDYQSDTHVGDFAACVKGYQCADTRVCHKKIRPERDYENGKGCFYYPWNKPKHRR